MQMSIVGINCLVGTTNLQCDWNPKAAVQLEQASALAGKIAEWTWLLGRELEALGRASG